MMLLGWLQCVLAWRPLLDPLPLHNHWLWLLPPLALAIAVVYKALKLDPPDRLCVQSLRLTAVILLLMAAIAATLWLITELL